jgi:carboxypeptidase Q
MRPLPLPVARWRPLLAGTLLSSFAAFPVLPGHTAAAAEAAAERAAPSGSSRPSADPIARIREEGLRHSEVMTTLSHLTESIGPRLTGSPNLKRANEWTRETLASWGLTNAHLEAWGPFGRGWILKRFSAQLVEPYTIPLAGFPNAWSPGFARPLLAPVVWLDANAEADLERYKGKLKGAIVLMAPARELEPHFEPLASRMAETNLLRLANAAQPRAASGRRGAFRGRSSRGAGTNAPTRGAGPGRRGRGGFGRFAFAARALAFVQAEGAALAVNPSPEGDGGTIFVAAATLPGAGGRGGGPSSGGPRVWSTNAPDFIPQITLAVEDYNRIVRMIQQGGTLKMAVDLEVQYQDADPMAYNTVAEIPGTDLKDEMVMLGAHLDSWHSGTGATDNGAGVAAAMEAVRILQTLHLEPRRTIRIGLWTGEEQGLLGSRAYVARHFGYYTNDTRAAESDGNQTAETRAPTPPSARNLRLVRQDEYERLAAYFNLDNGAGKIRGVYLQGNEAVRPIFRQWLEPFADLDAETLSLANTGGTDHTSFDAIGLPSFQFIQDPIEYWTRTHHSNADVLDRVPPDDLKQAATLLAAFTYDAAMRDQKLPRKPVEADLAP